MLKSNVHLYIHCLVVHLYVYHCFVEQDPQELFESISQALLNAVDRDAVSGWGGIVHIM